MNSFTILLKGECPIDVPFRTGCLDSVVSAFSDAVEEPIDMLFLGGWVKGFVVGHLRDEFFKKVNVFCYVSSVNVSEVFYCVA